MFLKKNTKIRLLENVKAVPAKYIKALSEIQRKNAEILEKFEVVTVTNDYKDNNFILIKNFLGEPYMIPSDTLFKIVGKEKSTVTSATNPISFPKSYEQSQKAIQIRAVQKMQVIASNVASCDNSIDMGKYIAAGMIASMAVSGNIERIYANKLLAMCTKLIGSAD